MYVWIGSLARLLSFCIAKLPRAARFALGDLIGILWFDVFRLRRRVALENLRMAYPEWTESKRVAIARKSVQALGRTLTDFTLFPFFDQRHVSDHCEFEGLAHLEKALADGKGVFLLSLHLGNGDLAVAGLSRIGYKINLVSKVFKTKWVNDLWFGMRGRHGTRFIAPAKSSFEILKALKRKEVVAFVLDQFMGPPVGVRTTFFGHTTGTAVGLAVLEERTGAPVLPSYSYRRPDGKLVVVFEAMFEKPSHLVRSNLTGDASVIMDESLTQQNSTRRTQEYTDKIEQIVRRHPEQWMWIHRRWKQFRE